MVIVIIGIMVGMTVLSMATLGSNDQTEKEARRLTALVQLLGEEALVQGRDYGVEFFADGYQFLSWDPDERLWSPVDEEAALRRRALPEPIRVILAVDGREVVLDTSDSRDTREADELVPQVAVFSSGEFTPFELFLVTDSVRDAWTLRGLMHGELELLPPEDLR